MDYLGWLTSRHLLTLQLARPPDPERGRQNEVMATSRKLPDSNLQLTGFGEDVRERAVPERLCDTTIISRLGSSKIPYKFFEKKLTFPISFASFVFEGPSPRGQ